MRLRITCLLKSIYDSDLDDEIQHRKDEMMEKELEKILTHVVGKEQ